jgi:hypothetical protein
MIQVVDAIYEHRTFRLLRDIGLPERQVVKIAVMVEEPLASADDLSAWALVMLAERNPSFAFLADAREDIYAGDDGEPIA